MEERRKQTITRFLNDSATSSVIYDILLKVFMKSSQSDIYMKGGEKIAIEKLNQAWEELNKYRVQKKEEVKQSDNIGL